MILLAVSIIVSFLFLEWPWHLALILPAAALEGIDIWLWVRSRRWKPVTGAEAMVGVRGKVVSSCEPQGQAQIKGQLWTVVCTEGARRGDTVAVERVEGNRLYVRPL
jgi:membrane protein implicated in regulation of membrane protease activity